ncbi:entericidin EcnA/B family protein [Enterobacter roggenkampii]|nr:entericidin [Enterobacter roggenkampii EC_38VIM1]PRW44197.1 entericidin EcnA/B family protein [Enterobacter roggenkampii]
MKAQRPLRPIFLQAGMMKRTVKILLLLALSSALLSGCNTTRGMGQDIQDLGHIISHAAS